ncbi:MAG: hypothetical protein LBE35_03055, partial [Clostridiales bacterium]|nr:hypothetical protein [Clostridiales bacterium]
MKGGILALMLFMAGIGVSIDGVPVEFSDQPPQIVDDRTLVPVRAVFEALGFNVDWSHETRVATLTSPQDVLIIEIGSPTFTHNGQSHLVGDVAAQIIGGSTMLPIRALVEAIGHDVGWEQATQTVTITTQQQPAQQEPELDLTAIEQELFRLVNAERAAGGLAPLSRNTALDTLSDNRVHEMQTGNLNDAMNPRNIDASIVEQTQMAAGQGYAMQINFRAADEITAATIFERVMAANQRV